MQWEFHDFTDDKLCLLCKVGDLFICFYLKKACWPGRLKVKYHPSLASLTVKIHYIKRSIT